MVGIGGIEALVGGVQTGESKSAEKSFKLREGCVAVAAHAGCYVALSKTKLSRTELELKRSGWGMAVSVAVPGVLGAGEVEALGTAEEGGEPTAVEYDCVEEPEADSAAAGRR